MRCPKCGFVSYPGLAQCKKCGHRLDPQARETTSPSILGSPFTGSSEPTRGASIATNPISQPAAKQAPGAPPAIPSGQAPASQNPPPVSRRGVAWHQELSGRVERFRRRRAGLRKGFDASTTLDLEFESASDDEVEAEIADKVIEFPQSQTGLDLEISNKASPPHEFDSLPLEKPGRGMRVLTSAAVEAGELALSRGQPDPDRVQIVLESPQISAPPAGFAMGPSDLPVAGLGRRFFAGLADSLVLALGAGLFALIFCQAGGRISPEPLNVAVIALMAGFFMLVYFGLFTAVSSATPGLLWMGLEVRTLDGTVPTGRESFWRAFGYAVSTAALLLGFVWALVDSDNLTWHDLMSGTFVTVSESHGRRTNRVSETLP